MQKHLKKIFQHSLIYGLGNIVVTLTGFLLIPLYTRYLTPEQYGIYALIALMMAFLTFVYDLGIYKAMFRWYFDYSVQEQEKRKTVISTVLYFSASLSVILTAVFLLVAHRLSQLILHSQGYVLLVRLMILMVFFNNLIIIPLSVFRVKEKPVWFGAFSFLRMAGIVGLNFLLLIVFREGLLGIYKSGLIVAMTMAALLFLFTRNEFNWRFSWPNLKGMLKFGLPFFPTVFFAWIIDFSGRYFLKLYTTLEQVGLYSLGSKIGQISMFVVRIFILGWIPIIFDIVKEKNAPEIFGRVMTYFFSVVLFISVVISVFGQEIIKIFASAPYLKAHQVIPVIAFSYLLYGVYMYVLTGLLIKKDALSQPLILGLAAGLNIGLNMFLIPKLGMMGAAYATLTTYLLVASGTYFLSQRAYFINYEFDRILKSVIIAVAIYTIGLSVRAESLALSVFLKAMLICAYPFLLYIIKFFRPDEWVKLKTLIRTVR